MKLHTEYPFHRSESIPGRLILSSAMDPEKEKPGICCYGKVLGIVLQFFGFAVRLEIKRHDDTKVYYINKKSLKKWKERLKADAGLPWKHSIFKRGALDRFISLVLERQNKRLQAKEEKPVPQDVDPEKAQVVAGKTSQQDEVSKEDDPGEDEETPPNESDAGKETSLSVPPSPIAVDKEPSSPVSNVRPPREKTPLTPLQKKRLEDIRRGETPRTPSSAEKKEWDAGMTLAIEIGRITLLLTPSESKEDNIPYPDWLHSSHHLSRVQKMRVLGGNDETLIYTKFMPNLETLVFEGSSISEAAIERMTTYEMPKLKILSFNDSPLTVEGCKMLSLAPWFKNLEELHLMSCKITNEGMSHFSSRESPLNLEVLNLALNEFDAEALIELDQSDAFPELEELYLTGCPLGNDFPLESEENGVLSKLKTLYLNASFIGEEGLQYLERAGLKEGVELKLDPDDITEDETEHAAILKRIKRLSGSAQDGQATPVAMSPQESDEGSETHEP